MYYKQFGVRKCFSFKEIIFFIQQRLIKLMETKDMFQINAVILYFSIHQRIP